MDNAIDLVRKHYDADPEEIQAWIGLARRYLELPELMAYSEHAMYIGQKL